MAGQPQILFSKSGGALLLAISGLIAMRGTEPTPVFVPGHAPAHWPTVDGRLGTHYSPLADITASTVEHLEIAWTYRTGDVQTRENGLAGTAFEATPIMVDGLLYVSTPFSRAIALDAETGEEVWSFDPVVDRSDRTHTMTTSRGLAHWADPGRSIDEECASRILLASYDARLFALDARSGAPCSDFAEGQGIDLGDGIARIEGRRHQFKHAPPPTVVG